MAKNIIICSDGTGNTFESPVTNVTHLIKYLALDRPANSGRITRESAPVRIAAVRSKSTRNDSRTRAPC